MCLLLPIEQYSDFDNLDLSIRIFFGTVKFGKNNNSNAGAIQSCFYLNKVWSSTVGQGWSVPFETVDPDTELQISAFLHTFINNK